MSFVLYESGSSITRSSTNLKDTGNPEFMEKIPIFFFSFFFIEVQLIDNVVLVSGVQHSDSVIHI